MATILVTWEFGAGLGHLMRCLPIVATLCEHGHQVVAAMRNVAKTQEVFGRIGVACLQAPNALPTPTRQIERPRTHVHLLYNNGFAEADQLASRVEAWSRLYDSVRPDLILFEHSPTALLAARRLEVKRAVIGTGFTCPANVAPLPDLRPWLSDASRALHEDEQRLLDQLNHLLTSLGAAPLKQIASLYHEVDAVFLATFPELDPYPNRAPAEYFGVWPYTQGEAPRWPAVPGKRIFVYPNPSPVLPHLLTLLNRLRQPTIVYIDGLSEAVRSKHESATLRFASAPLDLASNIGGRPERYTLRLAGKRESGEGYGSGN
jgi:hypothetical protein